MWQHDSYIVIFVKPVLASCVKQIIMIIFSSYKVRIFWEGHKLRKNLPLKIWHNWVASNFKWKIFSNFVAFSKYPNFKIHRLWMHNLKLKYWRTLIGTTPGCCTDIVILAESILVLGTRAGARHCFSKSKQIKKRFKDARRDSRWTHSLVTFKPK